MARRLMRNSPSKRVRSRGPGPPPNAPFDSKLWEISPIATPAWSTIGDPDMPPTMGSAKFSIQGGPPSSAQRSESNARRAQRQRRLTRRPGPSRPPLSEAYVTRPRPRTRLLARTIPGCPERRARQCRRSDQQTGIPPRLKAELRAVLSNPEESRPSPSARRGAKELREDSERP